MTANDEDARLLAELTRLLEAWGGEPRRWPPDVRTRIEALTASGPHAQRLLAEARALDGLLDRAGAAPASLAPAKAQALADRIVSAALSASAGPAAERGRVIALPVRPRHGPAPRIGNRWQAAGLMAASLLVGIYLGGSVNLAPVMQELAEAVGISTVIDPTLAALGDDLGDEETP